MKELSIQEIHEGTLGILKKIIDICDKVGVNYYLAYGSLIGAVRHGGFIPWDDDLDIVMLRPDYEVFCQYCMKHERELYPFKLINRQSEKKYPYNIARFNDLRYKAVYENVQEYDSGMFIDVYPLDGAGHMTESEVRSLYKKRDYLMKMILWSIDDHYEPSKHNKWYRSAIKYFVRSYAKFKGSDYFLNKMEDLKNQYEFDSSEYVAEMVWDIKTVLCKKSWFGEGQMIQFEDIKVKAPKDIDSFLKVYYGDYMKLPPVEQRVPSHGYALYKRE